MPPKAKSAPKVTDTAFQALIELVRKCECIYNPQHPYHSDAIQAENIWASITDNMRTDNPMVTSEYAI